MARAARSTSVVNRATKARKCAFSARKHRTVSRSRRACFHGGSALPSSSSGRVRLRETTPSMVHDRTVGAGYIAPAHGRGPIAPMVPWTWLVTVWLPAAHALNVDVAVVSRHPFYAATVMIDDIPPGTDVVTTYVPLHLRHAHVHWSGPAVGPCGVRDRTPFGGTMGEAGSIECTVPTGGSLPTYVFTVNGTAAYEPVRFPVAACRRDETVNGTTVWSCQTNERTWALLSPLDRVAACQVVGVVAFGFWITTICFVCLCCLRFRTWHPYVPVQGHTVDVRCDAGSESDESDDGDDGDGDDDHRALLTKQQERPMERGTSRRRT